MRVLVLGSGVVGVASAWYLARAGHEVTVLDRQPAAGMETSFANAGMIAPGHSYSWASPRAPMILLKSLWRNDTSLRYRLKLDPRMWAWSLKFLANCTAEKNRRNTLIKLKLCIYSLEETDRLIGLELGADDYISKPFSPRELVARVRTVLRRASGSPRQPGIIRAADLEIDLEGHRLTRAGAPVKLSRIEFSLLAILAQHPGQTFTRAQLLDRLHGVTFDGYDRSIDAHIKNLRRKLEPDPANPRYVLTVYGIGYQFNDAAAKNAGAEGAHAS